MNDEAWSEQPENRELRRRAEERRAAGDRAPWRCPECGEPKSGSHTLRVHREIAHGIPSGLEP